MKKLKVFGHPWHTAHQAALSQLPFIKEYALQIEPFKKGLAASQREISDKFKYVDHYEKGYYDFAILHVDQQCIYSPQDDDRIAKGRIYQELNEVITDIPKIVINHMTPFHDKYDSAYVVRYFKKLIGNNTMVVNSHEARKQWGFGRTITHGMNAEDWLDLPKEPRVIIVLSPAGMEKAYRREFPKAVLRYLEDWEIPFEWIGVTRKQFDTFDEYKDFLGRSLVFFMPTWNSPMPRVRTEAMLSGCCVVTTPYQDASTFITSGRLSDSGELVYNDETNGFLTSLSAIKDPRMMDNPEYTANLIKILIRDYPDVAIKVGQKGKETAQQRFNFSHFEMQWRTMLKEMSIL
jgi:hypothetical protein